MREDNLIELFNSLSLEEKIGQLIQLNPDFLSRNNAIKTGPISSIGIDENMIPYVGSILNATNAQDIRTIQDEYLKKSKHKIPLLFMADIINGYKTVFPIPIALGCSFDFQMVKETAETAAKEAAVSGIHVTFSPMVDMVHDARWGRVMETYSEDTYLNSQYASVMVKGYQGNNDPNKNIASCVKHFAGYGGVLSGRDYNTVELSERTLREEYLPAYQAAINAGCKMVMTSFNTIDRIPVTANKKLLRDVLRNEWGFNGVTISDHSAVKELINHGVAENEKTAASIAIRAGTDIDMMTACYANNLSQLIKNGELDIKYVNDAALRVLKLKNDLGLFENPYRGANSIAEKQYILSSDFKLKAREAVTKSCVLLKNEHNILPLKKDTKIALIGPYSESRELCGMWSFTVDDKEVVSLKEGLEQYSNNLHSCIGCQMLDDYTVVNELNQLFGKNSIDSSLIDDSDELVRAIKCADNSDVIILAVGEHPYQSGEAASRVDLKLPDVQMNLIKELSKLNKPIITLVFSGRPLILNEITKMSNAVMQCWFPGIEGGNGIADILFGIANPSARLSISFPYHVGQCPINYSYLPTGRPLINKTDSNRFISKYIDAPNDPLYCFGYGLSYSDFKYSSITLNSDILKKDGFIEATVKIENISAYDGIETVQLYLRDKVGSVSRPVKELKAIEKVILRSKETKTVKFIIRNDMLKFYRSDMTYDSEPGEFELFIGHDSSTMNKATFKLIK